MSRRLTAGDARQSLGAHAAARGAGIHEQYGPVIGWSQLQRILDDRACVRYPCRIAFDAAPLQPGECAFAKANGGRPEDGFVIHIHPLFQERLDRVAPLALYQLVVVNYGDFASFEDAEVFGAAALGISREQSYEGLCELAGWLEARLSRAAAPLTGCDLPGCVPASENLTEVWRRLPSLPCRGLASRSDGDFPPPADLEIGGTAVLENCATS